MINTKFWRGKKVFITGHTGFKGSWLCLLLTKMGAKVTGYALKPPTEPSLFAIAHIAELLESVEGDIRNLEYMQATMQAIKPEIVIHMAAQPLVRESYKFPIQTYEINVMGSVNLLESVRYTDSVRAVINVTTDKCYENKEWVWGYRESEALGGYDPYSSSKGCSELVTSAYRNSFFNPSDYARHGVAVASARAGNVIGGGDWANDRLIPDCIKSLLNDQVIKIRNPQAVRPWQHVLEPLSGYLQLAEKLYIDGTAYGEGWNFGPDESDAKNVGWIVEQLCDKWSENAKYEINLANHLHEANYLKIDCAKARVRLPWKAKWSLAMALDKIIEWSKAYKNSENMRELTLRQIEKYMD